MEACNLIVFGVTVPATIRRGKKYTIIDIGGFATVKLGLGRFRVGTREWLVDAKNVVESTKPKFRKWFVSQLCENGFESTDLWKYIAAKSGLDVSNLSPVKVKEAGQSIVDGW